MKYLTLVLLLFSLTTFSQTDTLVSPQTDSLAISTDSIILLPPPTEVLPETVKEPLTGSLICDVTFDYNSGCATDNVVLTSSSHTLQFLRIRVTDTLSGIPAGVYRAIFYDCDSSHQYQQTLEIVENDIRYFTFKNNAHSNLPYNSGYGYDYTYSKDSIYPTSVWLNHGLAFGRGLDYENKSVKVESNYSFEYSVGQDYMILESPIALGFDFGARYNQSNFEKTDYMDTSIVHEQYRFGSWNLTSTFLASLYIKQKKVLDVGVKYNLPIYSRMVAIDGKDKLTTRGVHNYKDYSFVAHVGYWWGFIYAEYRPDGILISPYENAPKLTLGLRLNVPVDWW